VAGPVEGRAHGRERNGNSASSMGQVDPRVESKILKSDDVQRVSTADTIVDYCTTTSIHCAVVSKPKYSSVNFPGEHE